MAVLDAGIQLTITYWASVWDKIEVLSEGEAESANKVPVTEVETGYLQSTAFFAYNEANFDTVTIKTYAGVIQVAENTVDIQKTDRQSLTIVRKDLLS